MRTLRDLFAAGPMPQNFLQVGDRAPINLDAFANQPSGPDLDYSQAPVEIAGYGKGYRVKGDPFTAVLTDGRIVRMGADTGADQARQMARLKMQGELQGLAGGALDIENKRLTNQKLQSEIGSGKALTEFQGKSSGYGARAATSDEIISSIGKNGEVQPGLIKRSLEALPFVGDSLGTMANWTQSPDQQSIEQAQRDFINAVLRQESGAAIAPHEFDNARKQYFPQPGDTPEVIAQKAMNRQTAINAFTASAGPQGAKLITSSRDKIKAVFEAKKAIAEGRSKEAVIQRLESLGITNHGIR